MSTEINSLDDIEDGFSFRSVKLTFIHILILSTSKLESFSKIKFSNKRILWLLEPIYIMLISSFIIFHKNL